MLPASFALSRLVLSTIEPKTGPTHLSKSGGKCPPFQWSPLLPHLRVHSKVWPTSQRWHPYWIRPQRCQRRDRLAIYCSIKTRLIRQGPRLVAQRTAISLPPLWAKEAPELCNDLFGLKAGPRIVERVTEALVVALLP